MKQARLSFALDGNITLGMNYASSGVDTTDGYTLNVKNEDDSATVCIRFTSREHVSAALQDLRDIHDKMCKG